MTKAHVRWLESTLVRDIKRAARAEVMNSNDRRAAGCRRLTTADMEVFLENIRLLLPTLGVNVFATASEATATTVASEPMFELRWEDARASFVVRDGQYVVRSGRPPASSR